MYLLLLIKAIYCHLLDDVSMVNSKPTIDHINILIKAQSINIVAVSDRVTVKDMLAYKILILYLHTLPS